MIDVVGCYQIARNGEVSPGRSGVGSAPWLTIGLARLVDHAVLCDILQAMTAQNVSQPTPRTYGRSAARLIEELEATGATVVSTAELAAIRGVPADSELLRGLIKRLKASGWLVPLARQGMYEFVPARVGPHSSNDEQLELEALARGPNPPRFQVALGTAAFLRGYADTAPSVGYLLFDKQATVRPPRLKNRFKIIRTDPARLFGGEPLSVDRAVPVSTTSRLFIDAALYWQHAGDLRLADHWLAAASADVDAEFAAGWANQLGANVAARVGFLAERFGAQTLAERLATSVQRTTHVYFGPHGQGAYDARWHVSDAIGIAQSK